MVKSVKITSSSPGLENWLKDLAQLRSSFKGFKTDKIHFASLIHVKLATTTNEITKVEMPEPPYVLFNEVLNYFVFAFQMNFFGFAGFIVMHT